MEAGRCVGSRDRVVRITFHHQCLAALWLSRGATGRPQAAERSLDWPPLCPTPATATWHTSCSKEQKQPLGLGDQWLATSGGFQPVTMVNASDTGAGSSSDSQDCQVIQPVQATMSKPEGRSKRTAAKKRLFGQERKQKRQKVHEKTPIGKAHKVPSCRLLNSCPVGHSTVLSEFPTDFLDKRGYTDLLALSMNGVLVRHGFVLWLFKESSTRSYLQLGNAVMDEGWALDTDDACREVMLAYQEKVPLVPGLTVRGLIDGYIQLCENGQWRSATVAQQVQASVQKLQQVQLAEAYPGCAVEAVVQELEDTGESGEEGHNESAEGGGSSKKRRRSRKTGGDKEKTVIKKRGATAADSNGTGGEAFAFGKDGWANASPAHFSGGLQGVGQAAHKQAPTLAGKQTDTNGQDQAQERPSEAQGLASTSAQQPSPQGRPLGGSDGSKECHEPAEMSSGGTAPLTANETEREGAADAETAAPDVLAVPMLGQRTTTGAHPKAAEIVAAGNQASAGSGRESLLGEPEAATRSKGTGSVDGEAGGNVQLSMQAYKQLLSQFEASSGGFVAGLLTTLQAQKQALADAHQAQQACEAELRAAQEEVGKEKQALLLLVRYQQREMSTLRKEKAVLQQQEAELAAHVAALTQEKEEQEQTFKMRVLKGVAEGLGLPGAL